MPAIEVKKMSDQIRSRDSVKSQGKRSDQRACGTQLATKMSLGDPNKPLEEQRYYHGFLPRTEAVQLLQKDGDFLVRQSKKEERVFFVLSSFWKAEYKHYTFKCNEEGQCKLEGDSFQTVPKLVDHYYTNTLPLFKGKAAVLLNPIFKLEWELNNSDIIQTKKLGEGQFGEVYKGVLTRYGESRIVAVKSCNEKIKESEMQKFVSEATMMHKNVVEFIGVAVQRMPILIVMELVTGGSLENYLREHKNKIPLCEKLKFCLDAAAGMEYLSSKACIHRDLAAGNCLLDKDKNVKISDFGMSRMGDLYEITQKGKKIPVRWTALESLDYGNHGEKSDVWSFGILMWEIFADGTMPYPNMKNDEVISFIRKGNRLTAPANTPREIQDLMQLCWLKDPIKRPDFKNLEKNINEIQKKYSQ